MKLALRFISGKYQGGEFPIEENREIIVGRSSDLDMVLVEEMVSRKHARLKLLGGVIQIEDLGSTNGTFVNGERISEAKLREGDRILIGSNILKVVTVDEEQPDPLTRRGAAEASGARIPPRRTETGSESRMSGDLEEIPLPDLLQLFATSKKTAVLNIDTESLNGRIYMKQGVLQYAEIVPLGEGGGTTPAIIGIKALYRMISWPSGLFELNPPDSRSFAEPLDISVQEVLMEGFRQKDEFDQLRPRLPSWEARLVVPTPLVAPLRALEHKELDVFQCAVNTRVVGSTLDVSPLPDLDTGRILIKLLDRGYLHVSD